MLLTSLTLLFALDFVQAAPGCPMAKLRKRQLPTNLPLSQNEDNTGPIPSLFFDAKDQLVNVGPGSGHEYAAPGPNDYRGPCPGLNAAANHGFLPRSGITTIGQTAKGLFEAFAVGPEFSAALSVIAIALTGDPIAQTWSIGAYPPNTLTGLLSNPGGISYSHNTYESDGSPTRDDAYLNNGDAVSLNLKKFDSLYNKAENYTLDILRQHNEEVRQYSVSHNPYYFSAPFAGLVPPIAHHFVVNLMSNHSADTPGGFLNREVLKSFFAVSGPDDKHVWTPGAERIPLNWYRRPSTNPYGAAIAAADVVILATRFPDIVEFGGNTGTVNSFTGLNVGNLTGGVYNSETLLQGNNAACFGFQAAQQVIPSALRGVLKDIAPVLALVNKYLSPVLQTLNCPALNTWDASQFNQFPGSKYKPRA